MACHCRRLLAFFLLLLSSGAGQADNSADQARYFRIGTGPPGETQFLLGGLIASAISAPPGLPPCSQGGVCGVRGLIAVASATSGSLAIIDAIADGRLDAGFTEADMPFWAVTGAPPFAGHPIKSLRAVANIGSDQLHLVVPRDGPIHAMRDLRGRHISLGEPGSGSEIHSHQLLAALGIKDSEIKPVFLGSAVAADAMLAGKLDGFFVLDSAPVPSVDELAKNMPIRLIGITGPAAAKLRHADPLLFPGRIAGGTYQGVEGDCPTLAIGVTLLVSATLPDDLVFGMTRSLWQSETVLLLNNAHRGTPPIASASALAGLGLPLHPGAQRYYANLHEIH
jgi:TRAP transporter TAXI family solute receptor